MHGLKAAAAAIVGLCFGTLPALAQTAPVAPNSILTSATINQMIADIAAARLGLVGKLGSTGDASAVTVLPTGRTLPRTLADRAGDMPTPFDFMAAGQTSAQMTSLGFDAAPAINAAVAAGHAWLPCGNYRLDTPIVIMGIGKSLHGAGARCVVLQSTFLNGDVVQIGDGTATPYNVSLSGFMLYSPAVRASGYAIRARHTWNLSLKDFVIGGLQFGGISIEGPGGAFTTRIDNFEVQTALGAACIKISSFMQDVHMSNGVLGSVAASVSCNIGLEIVDAGGVYASNIDIIAAASYGVLVHPHAASLQSVFALFFTNFLSDTSTLDNFAFLDDGPITEVNFTNTWASSSIQGDGLKILNPNTDGVNLNAFTAIGNHFDGVGITAGHNITITGGRYVHNNQAAGGVTSGISIVSGDHITITGAKSGGGGALAVAVSAGQPFTPQVNHQTYGLAVTSTTGAVTHLVVGNNQFDGNITAGCGVVKTATMYFSNNDGSGC